MSEDGPSPSLRNMAPELSPDVAIRRHTDAWTERGIGDGLVALATHAAFAVARLPNKMAYEVTIVLTDDAEIRDLNRTWRHKDQPTNVLSFPAGDIPFDAGALEGDGQPLESVPLGDIVVAFETSAAEAQEKDIPLSDHLTHLIVHGTLHLLGHDHIEDSEAEEMEDLERQALATLGIADPYGSDEPLTQDGTAGLVEIER